MVFFILIIGDVQTHWCIHSKLIAVRTLDFVFLTVCQLQRIVPTKYLMMLPSPWIAQLSAAEGGETTDQHRDGIKSNVIGSNRKQSKAMRLEAINDGINGKVMM